MSDARGAAQPADARLHILYDPATHTAWAWGPTATDARQRAEAQMRELDARLAPSPDDESVAEHLDRCAVMPLIVPQRFVLDLLALLELPELGSGGQGTLDAV